MTDAGLWATFGLVVVVVLFLDLKVIHRKSHEISIKEALMWSGIWIALSLAFNLVIYLKLGHIAALQFLTGYLIEKSLSVDNIFIFLVIFSYFGVSAKYQHKVLFWGIIGALIFRAILIMVGAALINKFHWVIYIFSAFVIYAAYKMAVQMEMEIHPEKNPIIKVFRKFMPVTSDYHGDKFFINVDFKRFATPLLVVLLVVETTDVLFALDSIPAIFSITTNSFIVFTSNVFAILGLRALYFALAGIMEIFHYLKIGLSVILAFVGVKMLLSDVIDIHIGITLGFIALVLIVSIIASIVRQNRLESLSSQLDSDLDKP